MNFVFQPSLGGSFHETLVVSNVYDPSNDQVVTLKATISRADTFWLNTSSIDFGGVNVGEWSRPQSIVFVNNSKQSRTFMLKAGDSGSDERVVKPPFDVATDESPVLRFMVEEEKKLSSASAVGPEQELIEALERKGLAYERKGKADKAAKIRKQIEELKSRDSFTVTAEKEIDVEGSEGSKVDKAQSGSDTESQHNYSPGESNAPIADQGLGRRSSAKGSDGYVSLSIKGGESKVLFAELSVKCTSNWMLFSIWTIQKFFRVGGDTHVEVSTNFVVFSGFVVQLHFLWRSFLPDCAGRSCEHPLFFISTKPKGCGYSSCL